MDVALVAVIAAVALAAAATVAVDRARERRTAVRQRVLVNLGDEAIDGVLWARRGRLLVLRDARLFAGNAPPTTMDGEIVIDRDQVRFVQAGIQ